MAGLKTAQAMIRVMFPIFFDIVALDISYARKRLFYLKNQAQI